MNWITKFIKPKINSLLKRRVLKNEETLWTTCGCKNLIYKEDIQSNLKCCPKCGAHHKLSCRERFDTFFDNKEYELIKSPMPKDDPLGFEDNKKYVDRLKSARKITQQNDAVLIAKGKIKNIDVVVGAQDFRFIGGSFGAASGEAFIAGVQHSIENNMPFIFYRVQNALPHNGIVIKQNVSLINKFRFISYLFFYKSQIKIWFLLYPFLIFNLFSNKYGIVQNIKKNLNFKKPHKGKLLYEKRGFCDYSVFKKKTLYFFRSKI